MAERGDHDAIWCDDGTPWDPPMPQSFEVEYVEPACIGVILGPTGAPISAVFEHRPPLGFQAARRG